MTDIPDQISIRLIFAFDTPKGRYQDVLYFTEDEWAKRDQKNIDAVKQERVDAWLVKADAPAAVENKVDPQ